MHPQTLRALCVSAAIAAASPLSPIAPSAAPAQSPALSSAAAIPAAIAPATVPAKVSFEAAARAVSLSIQRDFYIERTGAYAKSITDRSPDYMWANGVLFSSLVGAARHDPATFRPLLDHFFTLLDRHWDATGTPPGYEAAQISRSGKPGNDKYYDDNAWMVITFMEAYETTHADKFLKRAEETLAFILSGWDDKLGGGIWWHQRHKGDAKNTCINAPGAVGAVAVAKFHDRAANIDWGKKLVEWTDTHLQDKDGLFFDNQKVSNQAVSRAKLTYNTGLMIRANLALHAATGEEKYLDEAKRIGKAANWFMSDRSGIYRDQVKFSHLLVEADIALYRATGDKAVLARAQANGRGYYERFVQRPPADLISRAAIARMLWLLADVETPVGQEFWKKADAFPPMK